MKNPFERPIGPMGNKKKSEEMAHASHTNRSVAAELRLKSRDESYSPEARSTIDLAGVERLDRKADIQEEIAGVKYDAEQKIKGMGVEQLRSITEGAIAEAEEAWDHLDKSRQTYVDDPSPENEQKMERADVDYLKLRARAFVFNKALGAIDHK
ncbi:hypothetical protein COU49_01845 [Candidatus Nomurabacteria bacterium CG10_big_fil_rev_8_21_14_0_10_35_16]|uniref:Uncharacterized protein n=1 Tax=Candidatus Nomurabacteria bacterium CG10_big_fil_rev_8_21_14_0_10_35_16 TaxID=1974731 RepID=A0A2H0TBC2_9BACT|nr:MAG: hypothetical protein COU49_01845 [Candidatus Nomurabacteria bacterium CG10_big_fil_rev_8_21_14_0_10_35_16]